jgi:phage terminase small subunit
MLTDKQEKFCINVASGMTLCDAYKNSYDAENMQDNTIYNKASDLSKKGEIRERINQLRKEARKDTIMSAVKRKEWLTEMILNDPDANKTEKLKALDILNKMDGEYVTKVEGNMNLSYEDKLKEIVDANEY